MLSLALLGLTALAGCAKPAPYSIGSRIPLETYTVRVSHTEEVFERDRRKLVVRFSVTGVNKHEAGRFFFMFAGQMNLIDDAGKKYGALPNTLDAYANHRNGPSPSSRDSLLFSNTVNPGEWVAVATVPPGARRFSLYIGNPARREGQPRAVIVPLDR